MRTVFYFPVRRLQDLKRMEETGKIQSIFCAFSESGHCKTFSAPYNRFQKNLFFLFEKEADQNLAGTHFQDYDLIVLRIFVAGNDETGIERKMSEFNAAVKPQRHRFLIRKINRRTVNSGVSESQNQ